MSIVWLGIQETFRDPKGFRGPEVPAIFHRPVSRWLQFAIPRVSATIL